MDLTVPQLADLGVKRVSTGGLMARTAIGALMRAGEDLRAGSFEFAGSAPTFRDINKWLQG
jgi:2-methylisocitrate lyase-like PEP mutase family enzyme